MKEDKTCLLCGYKDSDQIYVIFENHDHLQVAIRRAERAEKELAEVRRERDEFRAGQRIFRHPPEPDECGGIGGPLGSCGADPVEEMHAALGRAKKYDVMVREAHAERDALKARLQKVIEAARPCLLDGGPMRGYPWRGPEHRELYIQIQAYDATTPREDKP